MAKKNPNATSLATEAKGQVSHSTINQMNTEQNYSGEGDSTTPTEPTATPNPQTAPLAVQPFSLADNRQPAKHLSPSEEASFLDYLVFNDYITDDQRDWSGIIPVPDERMAPQLSVGGRVVVYLLDPKEYRTRVGKVIAVRLVNSPDAYQLGRLVSIDRQQLTFSHDNPAFARVTIPRKDVRSVYECIWSFNNPVL